MQASLLGALFFPLLAGPRERSPSRKNVAVGQPQLGAAIRVSVSESAMETPRHRGPAFVITRASQPGKFMSEHFGAGSILTRTLLVTGQLTALEIAQVDKNQKIWNASRICVSSLRRGHANLLCIVPILVYVHLE